MVTRPAAQPVLSTMFVRAVQAFQVTPNLLPPTSIRSALYVLFFLLLTCFTRPGCDFACPVVVVRLLKGYSGYTFSKRLQLRRRRQFSIVGLGFQAVPKN